MLVLKLSRPEYDTIVNFYHNTHTIIALFYVKNMIINILTLVISLIFHRMIIFATFYRKSTVTVLYGIFRI